MKRYFLSSLLLIFSWFCYGLTDIPEFAHRVIDTTHTLTDSQKELLESSLIGFEKPRTDGAQIAVLMIPKLDDETVEQYADRVFIQWKIGRKGQDNGIL
ncbi:MULTISPECIES: TPM domain-containing protein, partial [unclassified Gilliamella]